MWTVVAILVLARYANTCGASAPRRDYAGGLDEDWVTLRARTPFVSSSELIYYCALRIRLPGPSGSKTHR
jgi:hypothetical protein